MTLPSTQWFKQYHVAEATASNLAASDRPDWDTDAFAFLPYGNVSFNAASYNADTNTGYGVAPWTAGNGEALAAGNYVQGAGFPLPSKTMTVSSGKILYLCSGGDLIISAATLATPAATLDLTYNSGDTGFSGGIIVDRTTTTKWILGLLNFGGPVPIANPNTATIHWATSPSAGTVFHWE